MNLSRPNRLKHEKSLIGRQNCDDLLAICQNIQQTFVPELILSYTFLTI